MKEIVLKSLIKDGPQKTLKKLQDYKEQNNSAINNLNSKNTEIDKLINMFGSSKSSAPKNSTSPSKINRNKNSILSLVEDFFVGSVTIKKTDAVHNHLIRKGHKVDRPSVNKALSKLTIDGVLTREATGKYKIISSPVNNTPSPTGVTAHTGSGATILAFLKTRTKPTAKGDIQKHLNSKGIKTNAKSAGNALYILKKEGKIKNVKTGFYTIK